MVTDIYLMCYVHPNCNLLFFQSIHIATPIFITVHSFVHVCERRLQNSNSNISLYNAMQIDVLCDWVTTAYSYMLQLPLRRAAVVRRAMHWMPRRQQGAGSPQPVTDHWWQL